MPQMAPISWLILFVVFSITLVMFNTINFYCFIPSLSFNLHNNKILPEDMKWKW